MVLFFQKETWSLYSVVFACNYSAHSLQWHTRIICSMWAYKWVGRCLATRMQIGGFSRHKNCVIGFYGLNGILFWMTDYEILYLAPCFIQESLSSLLCSGSSVYSGRTKGWKVLGLVPWGFPWYENSVDVAVIQGSCIPHTQTLLGGLTIVCWLSPQEYGPSDTITQGFSTF